MVTLLAKARIQPGPNFPFIEVSSNDDEIIGPDLVLTPLLSWTPIESHMNAVENEAPWRIIDIEHALYTEKILSVLLAQIKNPPVKTGAIKNSAFRYGKRDDRSIVLVLGCLQNPGVNT